MTKLSSVLIAVVALEHLLFLVLEMFLWTTPTGTDCAAGPVALAPSTHSAAKRS